MTTGVFRVAELHSVIFRFHCRILVSKKSKIYIKASLIKLHLYKLKNLNCLLKNILYSIKLPQLLRNKLLISFLR